MMYVNLWVSWIVSSYRFLNFNFQNGYIEDWLTWLSKSEISAHLFHRISFWGGTASCVGHCWVYSSRHMSENWLALNLLFAPLLLFYNPLDIVLCPRSVISMSSAVWNTLVGKWEAPGGDQCMKGREVETIIHQLPPSWCVVDRGWVEGCNFCLVVPQDFSLWKHLPVFVPSDLKAVLFYTPLNSRVLTKVYLLFFFNSAPKFCKWSCLWIYLITTFEWRVCFSVDSVIN